MPGAERIESDYDDMNFSLVRELAVCATCVDDVVLARVLTENPFGGRCAFCERDSSCGKFSSVLEAIRSCFVEDWSEVSASFEQELIGESRLDDDYEDQEQPYSLEDLLNYAEYRPANPRLRKAMAAAFGDLQMYWRGSELPLEKDRHIAGWGRFKMVVKHKRRFTFWSVDQPADYPFGINETSVGAMLGEIATLINTKRMFKVYAKGSEFWRARIHDDDVRLRRNSGLYPPPTAKAVNANRMSPPGVVMFYGAEAMATAIAETADASSDSGRAVTYGKFVSLRDLVLLDLYDLASLPSYFDSADRLDWEETAFLRRFAWEIAQPVRRDGRNHIEYVPTQAFTEFVRFQMKADKHGRIDGLRYRSSRDGLPCVVLFCTGRQCQVGDVGTPMSRRHWLALAEESVKSERVRTVFKILGKARENLVGGE